FGAVCVEVDAHDLSALRETKQTPHEGRPLIILARSSPTQGNEVFAQKVPTPSLCALQIRGGTRRDEYFHCR
ncbi:MAG: hypothetical protein V7703_18005, partial [Hyphomicrobiales bacterium]